MLTAKYIVKVAKLEGSYGTRDYYSSNLLKKKETKENSLEKQAKK
jgi:hypothetical protein